MLTCVFYLLKLLPPSILVCNVGGDRVSFAVSPTKEIHKQSLCCCVRARRKEDKMTFNRVLSRALLSSRVGSRTMFSSSKADYNSPNWIRVGLAFGSTAFLWGLLFKQHSTGLHEYKVRNGLE